MPYFAVYATDAPGKGAVRATHRPTHRARLRAHDHPVIVRIGGPLLDDAGDMCGTMLVIEAQTQADVMQFVAGDPYAQASVYESVQIRPFVWGLGQPEENDG